MGQTGVWSISCLGFVGAGGLGVTLFWDISMYKFERAATAMNTQ